MLCYVLVECSDYCLTYQSTLNKHSVGRESDGVVVAESHSTGFFVGIVIPLLFNL